MPNVTHPGAGLETQVAIQTAASLNPASITLTNFATNNTSSTWILNTDFSADPNKDNADASGAIEMENTVLILEPGVIVRQVAGGWPGTWTSAFRWKGRTDCGITFGAGSSIYGRKEDYTPDATQYRAGAKFVGCTNVTVTGTNEAHVKNWYGDGIWFGSGGTHSTGTNTNVSVSNVYCNENLRNGWTVEDVTGGIFRDIGAIANFTSNPQAAFDAETDNATDTLQFTIDGADFQGHSYGLHVALVDALSNPVQINLRNIRATKSPAALDPSADPWGFCFTVNNVAVPAGSYVRGSGLRAFNLKSAGYRWATNATTYPLDTNLVVTLRNCVADNCSTNNADAPLDFVLSGAPVSSPRIVFDNMLVKDARIRKATKVSSSAAATNIVGTVFVQTQAGIISADHTQPLLPALNVGPFGRPRFSNKKKARTSANRGAV